MKQIFVTGASGFVGHHFRTLLKSSSEWQMIEPPAEFDMRDAASVAAAIDALDAMPDAVLHLAAQSNVPQAFADPEATFDINFLGTLRLLRAFKARDFRGRFLFVGSADAYGLVPEAELPVNERRALQPRNPYAVSKAASEALVYQWSQSENIDALIARPFNHIGPGQDERFAVAAFARQIAEISLARSSGPIEVGDIDVTRDFSDVRDVIAAYLALLTDGERGGVYNIGSGSEVTLREILVRLMQLAGVEAEIRTDPKRMRPAEQRRMCADTQRLRAATGWQQRYSLDQTLIDTLGYWKDKLEA
jgi:GDP-4-dehydro-6-deoxy-D-mannose reductase